MRFLPLVIGLLAGVTVAHGDLPHLHVRALPAFDAVHVPQVSLDLRQSWHQPFDGSGSRLTLSPTVRFDLHSPTSAPQAALDASGRHLQALMEVEDRRSDALRQHLTQLRAGYLLEQLRLLETWLEQTAALLPEQPFLNTWQATAESADSHWLQLELLELAGVTPAPPGRPVLLADPDFDSLLQACLVNSPELGRLEALSELEQASRQLGESRQRVHTVLTASLDAGLHRDGSSLGASVSLTFSDRTGSGTHAQLDLSPGGLTQSASLSWPPLPPAPESVPADYGGMAADAAMNLHELVGTWLISGATESRTSSHASSLLAGLDLQAPDAEQAAGILSGLFEHLQAMHQRDRLTLELASGCRLPYGYLPAGPLW